MNHIFGSDLFKDYMNKMIVHLDNSKNDDPNAARIDLLLPGINEKMMQGINATKACQDDIAQRHDIISEKLGTIMENQSNISNNIEHTIKQNLGDAISHIGKCMVEYDPDTDVSYRHNENQIQRRTSEILNHSSSIENETDPICEDIEYTVPKIN